jgi:large subunit ribosomal protein L15
MKQNTIKPAAGSRKSIKRIGRGGKRGTYAGRGVKGQKARTGGGVRIGFSGGQTPILMQLPKLKGFRNPNKVTYAPINVSQLEARFQDGDTVDVQALMAKNIMRKEMPVKLLGTGDLKKKLTITVALASKTAIEKVEKAGGSVTIS